MADVGDLDSGDCNSTFGSRGSLDCWPYMGRFRFRISVIMYRVDIFDSDNLWLAATTKNSLE